MAPANVASSSFEVRELSNALYATCQTREPGKLFTQEELLSFGVIPENNLEVLISCVNVLGSDGLFKLMTKDNRPCWKAISKEDAAKYQNLSTEEAIVFAYVESAGRDGIWTKTIRSKSNLHQIVFTRCLKSLESKRLIKPTQSAKNPTRKLYILSHLQPFEEVSGGPFFTDGSIDEEFVRQLSFWLEQYVYKKSWYAHRPLQNGKVDNALSNDGNDAKHRVMNKDKRSKILPMAPGYIGYPKIPELTEAINQSGVSSVTLKEAEVRHILDLLCWDGRLTKVMNGQAYKKVLPTAPVADKEDSYVESPCGGCPVFDLCEEGGPVNARTCVYFQDWLNI